MNYYGQALEDKFLNENYFKNKKNGVYIELVAMDGILYSNTKYFEDNHQGANVSYTLFKNTRIN